MKKHNSILFSLLIGIIYAHKFMVEINFDDLSQLHQLVEMGIDLDHHRNLTEVHAFVTEDEFQTISNLNFSIHEIPNKAKIYFEELSKKSSDSRNPMEEYHNYNELTEFLQNIADNYPNITKLESIGQSVQGRELWVMEISDNPGVNEIEPEFKYVANMHGDETVGRELSLYLIEWLVEGYGNNNRATNIINNTDVFIMPSMNPDGFENGSRYNANGVDLNRDFPDQFNDPNNSIFGREPETKAVMEWSWNHHFVLSANMHTGALVANYPFDGPNSGSYSATPDDDLFIHLSLAYANAHPNMESGGFSNGITNGAQWYAIFGGMQDWNYVWEGNCDITLEQNEVKWPNSNQLAGLWEDHREPMLAYLEEIHDGVRGLVIDINGEPINANISIQGIDHVILPDPEIGDYYRLLPPGTYTITAQAFGYLSESAIVTVPIDGYVIKDFQLDIDPWLAEAEIEDFETGTLQSFDWNLEGDANWQLDNSEVFEGNYSIKSGNINANQESNITINLDVTEEGQISFYKKVSCESTGSITGNYYDYLAFYIDGIEMDKWAGEINWSLETFPVEIGSHTFKWLFIKDGGVTSGSDAVWIDFVVFPPINDNTNECGSGDMNQDDINNVLDIVSLVNCVIENNCELCIGDINQDNILNVLDIVLLVNSVLGY
tara:strand:+ start:4224 stop:6209 length:1986 start_codon:yes stop_codon:yes gene_type:complete